VAEGYLQEVNERRSLNAFITELTDQALERAAASDKRIAKGETLPLDGICLAIKDNFCTKGVRTTAASRMLNNFVPTYEAAVTERLLQAGAVFLGKANMDEFGMGSSTENSFFGPTINPVGVSKGHSNLSPGGSSGGAAAAVAGGLVLGAIGTDTGGSVRQPAAFCGLVGIKPTYGLCSRWGMIAYASSLDQAGALGTTVEDVAILLDVMVGYDSRDSTSLPAPQMNFENSLQHRWTRKRMAFPREIRAGVGTTETAAVWRAAERAINNIGGELIEVSLPHLKYALPAYYIIALSEASSNLARYDGVRYGFRATGNANLEDMYQRTRSDGFGPEVKRRIMLGTFALSSGYYEQYYVRALKVRSLIAEEFRQAFRQADVLLMPTAPSGAFEIGSHRGDPTQMYLEDLFTVSVNLAGLPALSLPAAEDHRGMPLGLQIIGPQFSDDLVIRTAAELERGGLTSITSH
jgi:aspartyl-tRNA(Asn)/glutamyl-tRNA(Gln) amidotransferase subunit A